VDLFDQEDQVSITFRILDSKPKTAIVSVKGFIQSPEAQHFRNTLDHVDAKEVRRVILDLKKVPYISSSGIGVIVGYCKTKNEQEGCGAVAVVGLAPSVQSVMHTLGLITLIPQFDNAFSAAQALGIEMDTDHLGDVYSE
jgi:anti-anti-sigma factor